MSELNTSFAEPSYISRLALEIAPFSTGVSSKLFYNGGQLEHRLNLLLHLARASNKVGVLVADDGLGKTTLLTELQQRAGDELRLCSINSNDITNQESLLVKCLTDLGVEQAELSSNSNHEALLRNRFTQLHKLHIRPLLVLDDGHKLTDSLLTVISTWLAWKDGDDYLLQGVITSAKELTLTGDAQSRVQIVDLPPLEQKEVATYLSDRMSKAGYVGEPLFNAKDLKQFYKRSKGYPGLINQLAHQKLLGIQPTATKISSFSIPQFGKRWLGVTALVIIIALLLIYQDAINKLFLVNQEKQQTDIFTIDESEEIQTVIIGENDVTSNEQAERNELSSLIAQIPRTVVKKADIPKADRVLVAPIIVGKQQESSSVEDEEQTVSQKKFGEIKEKPILELLQPEQQQNVLHEDWVLQQQDSHYTFQLMGSWHKEEVYDFIDKYALTEEVAIFESLRNGRVWYALIYGVYDNKEAALGASSDWPAPLNTLPSWLRRFDSVQKQIISSR